MGARHRLIGAVLVGFVLLLGGCSSCKHKDGVPNTEEKPPDRLAPGETVEGKEHAFGLPLPRLAVVNTRLRDSVYVTSTLTPEEVTNFVSKRVKEGKITPGTSSTRLENVIPRDDAAKRITIEIRPMRGADGLRSEMVVRDTTPLPFEPNLTEEERLKKAGVTRSGHVIDPTKLQ